MHGRRLVWLASQVRRRLDRRAVSPSKPRCRPRAESRTSGCTSTRSATGSCAP